jgi:hypothetical protein
MSYRLFDLKEPPASSARRRARFGRHARATERAGEDTATPFLPSLFDLALPAALGGIHNTSKKKSARMCLALNQIAAAEYENNRAAKLFRSPA